MSKELKKDLKEFKKLFKQSQSMHDKIGDLFGSCGKLCDTIFYPFEFILKLICEKHKIDSILLDWFVYVNDFGAYELKLYGVKICNIKDFVRAVEK